MRGYDKWAETQATVERSDVTATPCTTRSAETIVNYDAGDVITWTDSRGEKQYPTFDVEEDTPLFQLVGGESVTIRYDPARPDRFHDRDLLARGSGPRARVSLVFSILAGLVALLIWSQCH